MLQPLCLETMLRAAHRQCFNLQANISKNAEPEDWRYREAATTALGAILEGPSTERLAAYVSQGLSFLLHAMKDTNEQVRHSTAWTIGNPQCPFLPVCLRAKQTAKVVASILQASSL